ncbi:MULTISPECIES: MBL fold metallo-hydrolase [Bacillaceae]|uniref:MBL fold metallo-hydrolase n=1 Tax=Bacillaceae TaxID=186817 RepID=UPI000C759B07|nr:MULTISPECIES: MBL fold metallo-hydrolase [Bacillaceae]PLR66073.1 MBL fold metallo-hydrolase [Bacillus sp. UMB0893]QNG61808.1 MBL fold metallo-hydrolase [Bacillus sp. PAMC26568]
MVKKYQNLDDIQNIKSFSDMRKWMKERKSKKKDLTQSIEQSDRKYHEKLRANERETSITWIGHSTFLIQMNGLNILTDPVWAGRMGVQKRLTEPGLSLHELPEIDYVLISHGHYDHLDFSTIKRLKGSPEFYVPAGLRSAFARRGYKRVKEAHWWNSFEVQGVKLSFVPAQHWTRRTLWDTNTSHWGGWVVEDKMSQSSIYFVGDTGYFRGFQDIGSRFNIETVLMPIGAYEPEWFMDVSHINPEDAIKAYLDLKAKGPFIPMHYGAYRLADDTGPEALDRLYKEWERLSLSEEQLRVMKIGETWWIGR